MINKDLHIVKGQNRGVALDMDGVVIDSMKYHEEAWRETFFHFFNFYVEKNEIYLLEGVKGKELIKTITLKHGISVKNEEIPKIHAFKRNYFNKVFLLEPMPGIFGLIELASRLKYKLALVTGTGRQIALEAISSLNFQKYFQSIITNDDVIKGKPFPDPYLLAAKRLGVRNNFCLVIENAPEGIKSAKAANMPCIAVQTTLEKKFLFQSDKICRNINGVKKLIESEYQISGGVGPWIL
jgi:beta-phosphoglucomutase